MVASPDDSSTQNSLYGVSCKSTTFCVAVGFEDYPASEPEPLIDTWNGSTWSASFCPGSDQQLELPVRGLLHQHYCL